jgi:aryl-alcohol dehydrogenase-like predicted oxidoreductase
MEYTFLGKTGMKVSRLCLGTMNFACQTREQDCFWVTDEGSFSVLAWRIQDLSKY